MLTHIDKKHQMRSVRLKAVAIVSVAFAIALFAGMFLFYEVSSSRAEYTTDYGLASLDSFQNKVNVPYDDPGEITDPHCGRHVQFDRILIVREDGTSYWKTVRRFVWHCH